MLLSSCYIGPSDLLFSSPGYFILFVAVAKRILFPIFFWYFIVVYKNVMDFCTLSCLLWFYCIYLLFLIVFSLHQYFNIWKVSYYIAYKWHLKINARFRKKKQGKIQAEHRSTSTCMWMAHMCKRPKTGGSSSPHTQPKCMKQNFVGSLNRAHSSDLPDMMFFN